MDRDNVSCCNAHSNFVFESIALELMGHEFFREFHLNRHVCAIKRYQRLVTNIAQISIIPHDLVTRITRDKLTEGGAIYSCEKETYHFTFKV
jgi:hypothetical protein